MPGPLTILVGGTVVDGGGGPPFAADVRMEGRFIAAVDPPGRALPAGARVVDCTGLMIAPGFIDAHSHADNAPFLPDPDPSKIGQGVTTEVVGNCGMSLAPRSERYAEVLSSYTDRLFPPTSWRGRSFADYWTEADEAGLVTNAAPLVGQGTLRIAVMGLENRPATREERVRMRGLLRAALDAGAFGLSTGLIYPPGVFTDTDELVDLAGELGSTVYASHIRGEGAHVEDSVDEALAIGREARVAVQISHHKATGRLNWGKTARTLARIDDARRAGLRVGVDVYPYTAGSTMLTACLPPWTQAGGHAALLERLQDPAAVAAIRHDLETGLPGWDSELAAAGPDGIRISATADHQFEGRSLADIAARLGGDAIDALLTVLRQERLRASMILFSMHEDDVRRVLAYPRTMVGSDGLPPGLGGRPHPRQYGTFPRILGCYVREQGLLSWESAIYKMTGLPADTFGLADRGRLAPGLTADVVVFDPKTVADAATYDHPVEPPVGIVQVYLGGDLVVQGTRYVGRRQGRRLRHPNLR